MIKITPEMITTSPERGVRAETAQQAVALVGHPEVNVYPLPPDAGWPGDAGETVWRYG